jgi:putative phosphoesterase
MRLAAIYDIHGNLPALEAVLADLRTHGVDEVLVGGDVVPGPMPRACLEALKALDTPVHFIHGNGEQDLLAVERGETPDRVPRPLLDVLRWVTQELPDHHMAEIAAWPASWQRELEGLGLVRFWHATPRADTEIFTSITPVERLLPVLDGTGASVLVCGHTHMQFDRQVGTTRVVNAGSVGMPFGRPGAYWALLHERGVDLHRTPYDLEAAEARIEASDYPFDFDLLEPPRASEMLERFEAAAMRA